MKLSVIITSYKFKEYIKQCIDSVLSQNTDFGFEILVRDDGTNDGTYEMLLETYASNPNIRILESSVNVGAIENLRMLTQESKGKYIAHIDGDDYFIDNDYFQRAVSFLENNPTYALYCSGCKYLENGEVTPKNSWIISGKPDFDLSDLLVENYASFGRVFKRTEFKKEIFEGIPYPDWIFNFEIIKNGRGKCETNHCVGIYRIHQGGMFSMTTEETKQKNKEIIKSELVKRYAVFQHKVITIVDSFVYNDIIRNKLADSLKWMKEDGHEVLLVSNTTVDKEILNNVKFYLYDSRNQLFQEKYENGSFVDFFKIFSDEFQLHDVVPETQKHGLSVLVNLFNALSYAKQQGYTHFQRFEVDDLFGEESRKYIKKVPEMCALSGKKGMFYCNVDKSPPDISFHYFYCSIDEFLNKVPRISKEQDYIDYLQREYGNKVFKIVEVFVYENLKKNDISSLLIRGGRVEMYTDFADTKWNTETSLSSFDSKYGRCTTRLYHIEEYNKETNSYHRTDEYVVYTHAYTSDKITRKVLIEKNNGDSFTLEHHTAHAGSWVWNHIPSDTKSISVFENNRLLYKEYASDCISYVKMKR